MITDEMVARAMRIAQGATPVGAGDGNTYIVSPPTMATMRAALTAVLPMIRAEVLEECAKVAAYGVQRAYRDFNDRKMAEGAQAMAAEILEAIRAMKGGDTLPAPWQPDQWLGFGKVD